MHSLHWTNDKSKANFHLRHQSAWMVHSIDHIFKHFYRPQRSCGKVIFSHVCFKYSAHGRGVSASVHAGKHIPPLGRYSPWADTPQSDTPQSDNSTGRHPQVDTPWSDTSPGQIPLPPRETPHQPQADVQTATAADDTHLTGMHSCYFCKCLTHWKWAYNHPLFYAYNLASAVADLRGGARDAPSWGSKFFHFHAVFGQKNRFAHTLGELATPHTPSPTGENPGSITVLSFHSRVTQLSKSTMIHFT